MIRIGLLVFLLIPMSGYAQQPGGDPLVFIQASVPQGWYWSIKAPNGTAPAVIGPYMKLVACRDMLGSAQRAHPFACHITGPNPPANCRDLPKLGFGYPTGYGPVPPNTMLPSSDCYQAPIAGGLTPGWYFPHFTPDGGVKVEKCSDLKKVIALRKKNKRNRIGYYFNRKCPGAPCITSNVSTACN